MTDPSDSDSLDRARRTGVPVLRPGSDEEGPLFNERELLETLLLLDPPDDARQMAADWYRDVSNPNVIFADIHFLLLAHIRPERAERIRRHLRMSPEMFQARLAEVVRAFGGPASGDREPAA